MKKFRSLVLNFRTRVQSRLKHAMCIKTIQQFELVVLHKIKLLHSVLQIHGFFQQLIKLCFTKSYNPHLGFY